jgi:uncharacterized repeat protein (TIGR01451 family)
MEDDRWNILRDNDDADSTPDNNPSNDNPVNPGDPNDDVVDESPNDPNSPGDDDEDDSDPAGPKVFDLALRKVQLTALPSFSYGQNVQFGISIFNQGNIDAKDIVIIDTLPCGLEYIVYTCKHSSRMGIQCSYKRSTYHIQQCTSSRSKCSAYFR